MHKTEKRSYLQDIAHFTVQIRQLIENIKIHVFHE